MVFPSTLKVAVLPITNVLEIITNVNGSTSVSGFEGKFLDIITSALKFKYDLVTSEDKEWGALGKEGNWTGLLGLLQKNEADIALGLAISDERRKIFDFSIPYITEDGTFTVATESSTINRHPFLEPFTGFVWGYILGSLFLSCVVCSWIRNRSFIQEIFFFLAILLRQGINLKKCKSKDSIMYASWLLFAFIVSSCYSATYLSNLALPPQPPSLQSFVDVSNAVQSGTHRCLVEKGGSVFTFLQSSKEGHLKTLSKHIEKNEWFFNGLDALTVDYVKKDSVVIESRSMLQTLIARLGMWSYELSSDVLMFRHVAVAFRKDFCCKRKLDRVLKRITEAGIMAKLRSDQHTKKMIIANLRTLESADEKQIFFMQIFNVFIITLSIYIAAFFVLISEMVYYRLTHKI